MKNHQQLKELLRVASGGVIFIITQKFQPFIVGNGVISVGERAFMIKSEFEQLEVHRRKPEQRSESPRQVAILVEIKVVYTSNKLQNTNKAI